MVNELQKLKVRKLMPSDKAIYSEIHAYIILAITFLYFDALVFP